MDLRIGGHLNLHGNFTETPLYAPSVGYTIFQVFIANPRGLNFRERDEEEFRQFSANLQVSDTMMVIHACYTINLCHPQGSARWASSVAATIYTLQGAVAIGTRCIGAIIHMGKNVKDLAINDGEAMVNFVRSVDYILTRTEGTLILETGAGQGTEVGTSIEYLAYIYWSVAEDLQNRVKICIDTCHIWAAGYDISTVAGVNGFFKFFDEQLGIDKVACVHLNDSKNDCGSRVDRHEDLGRGRIGETGLKAVVWKCMQYQIPVITETPCGGHGYTISRGEEMALIDAWMEERNT